MKNQDQQNPILVSIKEAARIIGIQSRQLREAINDGLVPHYKLRNSIMLVKVSEILSAMQPIKENESHD